MDPFELFGLTRSYAIDLHELEQRYRALQKSLHPDKHVQASSAQRRETLERAMQVTEAYRALSDDIHRAELLLNIKHADSEHTKLDDKAFLIEIMERREMLSDAKDARNVNAIAELKHDILHEKVQCQKHLTQLLSVKSLTDATTHEATTSLNKLRFYQRFLAEVELVEDALEAT